MLKYRNVVYSAIFTSELSEQKPTHSSKSPTNSRNFSQMG